MNKSHKKIIEAYIHAYNSLDPESMVQNMHPDLVFENKHGGKVDMRLEGREAFLEQAKHATAYFSSRSQTLLKWEELDHQHFHIKIRYEAVAAMDFPNGPKKGERIKLEGESTFRFQDGLIIYLLDESE